MRICSVSALFKEKNNNLDKMIFFLVIVSSSIIINAKISINVYNGPPRGAFRITMYYWIKILLQERC